MKKAGAPRRHGFVLGAVTLSMALSLSAFADRAPDLSDHAMNEAITYFEALIGAPISEDDAGWLRKRWTERFARTPFEVEAEIDDFLVELDLWERDGDAIALARRRNDLIDNIYCAAAQSGDPDLHRFRDIVAPAEVVIDADCAFGLVVTRFDIDGLLASQDLMAAIAGMAFDPEKERVAIEHLVRIRFDQDDIEAKALIAAGESRHAIADRFWVRLEGDSRKDELMAALGEGVVNRLYETARQFETLAMQQLASVDYVVEANGLRFTHDQLGEYLTFAETIAGQSFSLRDRSALQDAIIKTFLADPRMTADWIDTYRQANMAYLAEGDLDRKAAMVASWAAELYCRLSVSSDPNDERSLKTVFRENPIISSDCEEKVVRRQSDVMVAEIGGQVLTEGDVRLAGDWLAFILGRRPTPEEAAFDRDYVIAKFDRDPANMASTIRTMREIFAKQDNQHIAFLWEEERRKRAGGFYCHFKYSEEKEQAYIDMFSVKDDIFREDCERKLISTRADIDAVIGAMDFLGSLAGLAPFTVQERAERHEAWIDLDMSYGVINRLALAEWWSTIDQERRLEAITRLRNSGFTHVRDIDGVIVEWLNFAKTNVVMQDVSSRQCAIMAAMSQGYTGLYAGESGPGRVRPYGMMGYELAHLVPMNNAFAALCGGGR
jgi:hypothetical protein